MKNKALSTEQSTFDGNFQRKIVKKGEVLQRSGDHISHSYFVKSGLLRSYSIDEKGKEHIFMFGPEGWFVGDMEAQFFQKPAELFIDALEETEVEILKHVDMQKLMLESDTELFKHQMHKLAKRIGVLQRRIIMLMSAPAIDRYNFFIETYPSITQRVPQRMIASYLGIAPETLSSLKSERTKFKSIS